MSTATTSGSSVWFRRLVTAAAFGCAVAMLTADGVPAALASEMAERAALAPDLAPDDLEEPDHPELDEERLVDLVADAQRRLQLSGYDPGPIDGRMGLRTQRAIRAYQAEARRSGMLEALKGPAQGGVAPRPELVGASPAAPDLTR